MQETTPKTLTEDHFRLSMPQKKALGRLHIHTLQDLIYHFPHRYSDIGKIRKISTLKGGESTTIYGTISKIKTRKAFHSKIPMAEGVLEDDTGKIKVVWFNQAYIAKMFPEGSLVMLQGKITDGKNGLTLANPEIEKTKNMPIDASDTLFMKDTEMFGVPVYSESRVVTSRWFHYNIQKITEHVIAEGVKVLNTETGEHEEKDIEARDNPSIQTVVKPIVDKHYVLNVFHFADEVVKYLSGKV